MGKQRRQYTADFKFQVALEAARGTKTVSQIASEYGVHPTQVGDWKRRDSPVNQLPLHGTGRHMSEIGFDSDPQTAAL